MGLWTCFRKREKCIDFRPVWPGCLWLDFVRGKYVRPSKRGHTNQTPISYWCLYFVFLRTCSAIVRRFRVRAGELPSPAPLRLPDEEAGEGYTIRDCAGDAPPASHRERATPPSLEQGWWANSVRSAVWVSEREPLCQPLGKVDTVCYCPVSTSELVRGSCMPRPSPKWEVGPSALLLALGLGCLGRVWCSCARGTVVPTAC